MGVRHDTARGLPHERHQAGPDEGLHGRGTKIVVYNLADGFFATQASCTHVFAPLAKGKICEGRMVQCPFHRARFDIRTGEVIDWANFPPGIQVLNVVRGEKHSGRTRSASRTAKCGEARLTALAALSSRGSALAAHPAAQVSTSRDAASTSM